MGEKDNNRVIITVRKDGGLLYLKGLQKKREEKLWPGLRQKRRMENVSGSIAVREKRGNSGRNRKEGNIESMKGKALHKGHIN